MGTCSTKESFDEQLKLNFVIPTDRTFNEKYTATSDFYHRSEMVSIFKATDRDMKTSVIVKQLSKSINRDSIVHEIWILSRCDHPYIIKLLDYFESGDHYFLVYQFSEGQSIINYFTSKETDTSIEELRDIFRQILMTLNYLHTQNIFHGKIDMSSLYFGKDKLSVSGLFYAKDLTSLKPKKGQMIKHTSFLSTPFQAPEVIHQEYGFASDIWSAGVVFYCLVTAEMPFVGSNKLEVEKAIRQQQVNQLLLIKRGATEQMSDLIEKSLSKNPKSRPSAEELLNHPFFTSKKDGSHHVINTLQEIKLFAQKDKLSRKFYLTIADVLMTQHDKKAIAESFHKFDLNHDGIITLEEFTNAIGNAGLSYKESAAKKLFEQIDHDKNGRIEYSEFLAVFAQMRKEEFTTTLKGLFREIDTDNDEYITIQEFVSYLGQQPELSEEIEKFKKLAGPDKKITYDEFSNFVNDRLKMEV